jgi:hypothetical protein
LVAGTEEDEESLGERTIWFGFEFSVVESRQRMIEGEDGAELIWERK